MIDIIRLSYSKQEGGTALLWGHDAHHLAKNMASALFSFEYAQMVTWLH